MPSFRRDCQDTSNPIMFKTIWTALILRQQKILLTTRIVRLNPIHYANKKLVHVLFNNTLFFDDIRIIWWWKLRKQTSYWFQTGFVSHSKSKQCFHLKLLWYHPKITYKKTWTIEKKVQIEKGNKSPNKWKVNERQ